MLRVRFHGRGGHGVKTASRILGTAAFLTGLAAQDSPLYGAERRGAAVAAFTRIGQEAIRERGPILAPQLILVADETLLGEPATGVLAGADTAAAVYVNSSRDGPFLANQFHLSCPVLTSDLTSLTLEVLGRGSASSGALGAIASALTGIIPPEMMERAVRAELADIDLSPPAIEKNVELARRVARDVPAVHLGEVQVGQLALAGALHVPTHFLGPEGVPILCKTGNAAARHTGAWRTFRPVIDRAICSRCGICALVCPDGAIATDADGYPVIDYDNCKGCLLCHQECPLSCIPERKEGAPW